MGKKNYIPAAWELKQITLKVLNDNWKINLAEALELCKKRAEAGYGFAVYEKSLSLQAINELVKMGYSFNRDFKTGTTEINWNGAKEPQKNDNSKRSK
jgi:hypothetical protein